jgi:2,3-dihydroxybenzoate-AMP ligase
MINGRADERFLDRSPAFRWPRRWRCPTRFWGERLCLYLTVTDGHRIVLDDVSRLMESSGAARFKIPERLVVVDAMPMTKVGKVDKKALRADIDARLERET